MFVNKICVGFCIHPRIGGQRSFPIAATAQIEQNLVTFLPFQNLQPEIARWKHSTCAAACLEDHSVNPTSPGRFLYESLRRT